MIWLGVSDLCNAWIEEGINPAYVSVTGVPGSSFPGAADGHVSYCGSRAVLAALL